MKKLIALLIAITLPASADLNEDIKNAKEVLIEVSDIVDSLTAIRTASELKIADSTLVANKVSIMPIDRHAQSGLRDTMYVLVDIPYSTWGIGTQRLWRGTLKENGVRVLPSETIGRYRVHKGRVPILLALLKKFIADEIK